MLEPRPGRPKRRPPLLLLLFLLSALISAACAARSDDPTAYVCSDSVLISSGESRSPPCRINCFRADPVCGSDGVTYWCGCADAACAGARVVKHGPCDLATGNSGSASLVPGQTLLLVHTVWLFLLGFSAVFALF